jgi:hypothetical protein
LHRSSRGLIHSFWVTWQTATGFPGLYLSS